MRILLLGYGKMGKAIEQVALQRDHQIVHKIDSTNRPILAEITPGAVDVAIEFSQPTAAYENIYQCLSQQIPVLSGTTGWLDRKEELHAYCQAQQGTFFYASNFSIGMHIFYQVNTFLAKLMNQCAEYDVTLKEVHHLEKKDRPSGTALTLAEGILRHLHHKKDWALAPTQAKESLPIFAQREKDVPGTHTVTYTASADTLTFQHTAHSREGFALGAVRVAEWMQEKQGILSMEDFLQLDRC
ncbi:MAG: 4-hydroxy-tetrahydrodipicolinate reductase [Roseivirga sp.]